MRADDFEPGTTVLMFPSVRGTVLGAALDTGKVRVQDDQGTIHHVSPRALQVVR